METRSVVASVWIALSLSACVLLPATPEAQEVVGQEEAGPAEEQSASPITLTPTDEPLPEDTITATIAPSATHTVTASATPTATDTPVPTSTATSTATASATTARTPTCTLTPEPTPTPAAPVIPVEEPLAGSQFLPKGEVRVEPGHPCPGCQHAPGYIIGNVFDAAGRPLCGVRVLCYNDWHRYPVVGTKGGGEYDIPVIQAATVWKVSVVDELDQPLSPEVDVPFDPSVGCWYRLDWQRIN